MACMEHVCCEPDCDWFAFDNEARKTQRCPLCGGRLVHYWDEECDNYGEQDGSDK